MSIKIPMTPAGIEPATFRFVAQQLNHCATAVPLNNFVEYEFFFSREPEAYEKYYQKQRQVLT